MRLRLVAFATIAVACTFIDVGQGDGILIQAPRGYALMIDTGGRLERNESADGASIAESVGEKVVVPFLIRQGIHHVDAIRCLRLDRGKSPLRTTADLFRERNTRAARRIPKELWRGANRKLKMLDVAATLSDLAVPSGNRLEGLQRGSGGRHSIRINDQYRLTFRWEQGHAYEVKIEDYH